MDRFAGIVDRSSDSKGLKDGESQPTTRYPTSKGDKLSIPAAWKRDSAAVDDVKAGKKTRDTFAKKQQQEKAEKKLSGARRLVQGFGYDKRISDLCSNYLRAKQQLTSLEQEKRKLVGFADDGRVGSKISQLGVSYESQLNRYRNVAKKLVDAGYWDRVNAELEPLHLFTVKDVPKKVESVDEGKSGKGISKDQDVAEKDVELNESLVKRYLEQYADASSQGIKADEIGEDEEVEVGRKRKNDISTEVAHLLRAAERMPAKGLESSKVRLEIEKEETSKQRGMSHMSAMPMYHTQMPHIPTPSIEIAAEEEDEVEVHFPGRESASRQKARSLLETSVPVGEHKIKELPGKLNLSFIKLPDPNEYDESLHKTEVFYKLNNSRIVHHDAKMDPRESERIFFKNLFGIDIPEASQSSKGKKQRRR